MIRKTRIYRVLRDAPELAHLSDREVDDIAEREHVRRVGQLIAAAVILVAMVLITPWLKSVHAWLMSN